MYGGLALARGPIPPLDVLLVNFSSLRQKQSAEESLFWLTVQRGATHHGGKDIVAEVGGSWPHNICKSGSREKWMLVPSYSCGWNPVPGIGPPTFKVDLLTSV